MRNTIKILFVVIAYIFLASGCSSPNKEVPQEKSADTAPLHSEQKNGPVVEINSGTFREKLKNEETASRKIAYITIDDGPSRNNTTEILNILKKNEIKATFFVLPKSNMDDVYKQIINEGHIIGNHSYSHANYLYASAVDFEKDLTKAKAFIFMRFNYNTTIYRFPGGSMGRNKNVIQKRASILKKHGYRYFDWDVSVADTDKNLKNYGDEKFIISLMTKNIVNNTKGKKQLIVLMHDDSTKTYTPKALPYIIQGLKKQGYTFGVLTNYK